MMYTIWDGQYMRLVMISGCNPLSHNSGSPMARKSYDGVSLAGLWLPDYDDQYTRVLMMSVCRESGYYTTVGHKWPASYTPFQWRIAIRPLVARLCMLTGKAHAK